MSISMTPSRPYLLRAMYDWIVDNDLTPHIVVDAERDDVQVPEEYIENGQIVLNISPMACQGLHLENDRVVFSARFKGHAMQIFVPPMAVVAIYAKENGKGMVFGLEEDDGGPDSPGPVEEPGKTQKSSRKGKPKLTIVK